jgi:hypothetical protein
VKKCGGVAVLSEMSELILFGQSMDSIRVPSHIQAGQLMIPLLQELS